MINNKLWQKYTHLILRRPVSVTILSSTYLSNLLLKLLLIHSNSTAQTPQYTTLRVPVIDQQLDYLSVTLIGENLICGSNLHVMPLTASQTDRWTGIWHTCELITELTQDHLERCIFTCHCRGGCAQIQICKRPRTIEESSWVLCYIYIPYQSAGT